MDKNKKTQKPNQPKIPNITNQIIIAIFIFISITLIYSYVSKTPETIKQLSSEFIKAGNVDPEIILEVITSSGLTRMKEDVLLALNKKRKENNQLGQLSQQVEQLDKQLKETTSEAQKLQQEVQKLSADKLQLERDRLEFEKQLKWYQAKTLNSFNEEKLELEKKGVQLEGLQLLDENHRNDEVKNST